MRKLLLAAGAIVGLGLFGGTANAGLLIVTTGQGGNVATNEPPQNGGPGFPCTTCTTNPVTTNGYEGEFAAVYLQATTTGVYKFTFEGSGNSTNINTFTVAGHTFTSNPPGATGAGSTANGATFTLSLTAGQNIAFTMTSQPGSTAPVNCSVSEGSQAAHGCDYLVALGNSTDAANTPKGPQNVAWIGFSDGNNGAVPADEDYQDLVVRVETPEPVTLGLLGTGLIGLALTRRRRSARNS